MLARLPKGSREAQLTLTTDNGTQFTSSRFLETLGRLGIMHRRTAYDHLEDNSYIERFHCSSKKRKSGRRNSATWKKRGAASLAGLRSTITTGLHHGVINRIPHESFLSFAFDLKNEALTV
jgi:hypothetical protein